MKDFIMLSICTGLRISDVATFNKRKAVKKRPFLKDLSLGRPLEKIPAKQLSKEIST